MSFKPAEWTASTAVGTWVVAGAFVVTLLMSFWGSELWPRLMCLILGIALLGSWLFSVKSYTIDHGAIRVHIRSGPRISRYAD